jgi:hypothetical protein
MSESPKKSSPKNSALGKFVRFTGMGLQMGVTIWVASLIGDWLDKKYPSESFSYFKICTILAVFGTTYSIIRQVTKMGQEDEQ